MTICDVGKSTGEKINEGFYYCKKTSLLITRERLYNNKNSNSGASCATTFDIDITYDFLDATVPVSGSIRIAQ